MLSCPQQYDQATDQLNRVSVSLASSVLFGTMAACLLPMTHKVETGALTSCILIGLAVCLYFTWITIKSASIGGACMKQEGFGCRDIDALKTGMAQAINWMVSFVALWVLIQMYRDRMSAWALVGVYMGMSSLGSVMASSAVAWVDSMLGQTFKECTTA